MATGLIRQIAKLLVKENNLLVDELLNKKSKLTKHECYVPVVDRLVEKCFSLKVSRFLLKQTIFLKTNKMCNFTQERACIEKLVYFGKLVRKRSQF